MILVAKYGATQMMTAPVTKAGLTGLELAELADTGLPVSGVIISVLGGTSGVSTVTVSSESLKSS